MRKQIILASILIILAIVVSLTGGVLATNEQSLLAGQNQNTTENIIQNNANTLNNIIQNNTNILENTLTLQNSTNSINNTMQNNIENVNSNQQTTTTNTQITGTIDNERLQGINEELYNLASTPKKDNRRTIVAAIIAITTFIIAGLIVLWYRTNGY